MGTALLAERHRWAAGALAAGALGMFLAALMADCTAGPPAWTVAVDAGGAVVTRMTAMATNGATE
jgi:hypothetical protein